MSLPWNVRTQSKGSLSDLKQPQPPDIDRSKLTFQGPVMPKAFVLELSKLGCSTCVAHTLERGRSLKGVN